MDKRNDQTQSQIIPSRIREARISRGYSLNDLSILIGVSSQAISQYELGLAKPSPAVLMKIVEILDFPLRFFRKPQYTINQDFSNSAVYFRSMKSATKKDKEAYQYRIKWTDEAYQFLNKYIDFPKVDLPPLAELAGKDLDYQMIEDTAILLRDYWNLGNSPIPNMVSLLQEKGFVICNIDFNNKKIDAFSRWFHNVPYIVHGSDKNSSVRSRFDLAHELGHLVLHSHIEQNELSKKEILDRIENETNYFAGAFLLPHDSFSSEIFSISIDHFTALKKRWKVSIAAIIKRCEHLNLLSENQVKYFFIQMNKRGIRSREPLDDSIDLERPYLFKQALELLINNNVLTVGELLDEFPLTKAELDSLLFLPVDLLARKEKILKLSLIKI